MSSQLLTKQASMEKISMFDRKPVETVEQPLPKQQQQNFDYTALDPETRSVVKQRANEIRSLMRRTIQVNIEIGQKLIEVKPKLRGQFGAWIQAEFGWGQTMACKFIHVAKNCEEVLKFSYYENLIDLSALYLIAEPSTPQEARQELLNLAEKGEKITNKRANIIIAQHKIVTIISKPSTPQEVRQELLNLAEKGGKITDRKIDKIIDEYTDAANHNAKQPITFDNPPGTPETETQQIQKIQSLDEMSATVEIDPKVKLLEADFAGKGQSKKEERQRNEAQLAESEMCSSSDAPVSLHEQVSDNVVEKDQSKEELQRENIEVKNCAPGSSNFLVKLLEPRANETDNHPRQDEANDVFNQTKEQEIGEKDRGTGNRLLKESSLTNETGNQAGLNETKGKANQSPQSLENGVFAHVAENLEVSDNNLHHINAKQLVEWIITGTVMTKERLNVSTWRKAELVRFVAELERFVTELERIARELKQELENEH